MDKAKRNQNNKLGFTQPFFGSPKKLRRAGFTLGEIITTVAIIGTITAIAVPQYLRIRMNTNMEMVKQQMRIVAEKMTEIQTKKGTYPDQSTWPDQMNPSDPDEASLMGNLSAIDEMCYTANKEDYTTNDARTIYIFCSKPKPNACGKWAGTKRFCIHNDIQMSADFAPGTVGEMETWNAMGTEMLRTQDAGSSSFNFSWFVQNSGFNDAVKELINRARWNELAAVNDLLHVPNPIIENGECVSDCSDPHWADTPIGHMSYSYNMFFSPEDANRLGEIANRLKAQGITMLAKEKTVQEINDIFHTTSNYQEAQRYFQEAAAAGVDPAVYNPEEYADVQLFMRFEAPSNAKAYEVAFQFNRPMLTQGDYASYLASTPWATLDPNYGYLTTKDEQG